MDEDEIKKIKSREDFSKMLGTPLSPGVGVCPFGYIEEIVNRKLLPEDDHMVFELYEIEPGLSIKVDGQVIEVLGFYDNVDQVSLVYRLPNTFVYSLCINDSDTMGICVDEENIKLVHLDEYLSEKMTNITKAEFFAELYRGEDFVEYMPTGHLKEIKKILKSKPSSYYVKK